MITLPAYIHIGNDTYNLQPHVTSGLVRVVWDDENPDYNYESRTRMSWESVDNPPAVNRFYPEPVEKAGDFRVNLAAPDNWRPAMTDLNNYDGDGVHRVAYATGSGLAMYNQTGWPKQAYLIMSGNVLRGEFVGDWYKFQTLKQSDVNKARGMTKLTHPWFVQSFACVTWDREMKTTKHIESSGTARGQVYYYLVTKEGIAYIPKRHVIAL